MTRQKKTNFKHVRARSSVPLLPREDIRQLNVFTIDPDTAKDFDDALSLTEKGAGWYELGVHIADVTHFLPLNSPTDLRAQKKATSMYLVNKCLPMLPPHLSENACSLVPGEDRNTFSVFFEMNDVGNIRATRFAKTLIHSKKRFTYKEAQHVLDTGHGPCAHELLLLGKITRALRKERYAHGGIEFESEEIQFSFNDEGDVTAIRKKEVLETMQLVEECMLLANVAVAKVLQKAVTERALPCAVYRVHDGPQGEKLLFLRTMLTTLRIPLLGRGRVHSKALRAVMERAHERGVEQLVQMVLLRSMGKAEYVTKNTGHFGLGFRVYTHFTSPIRRYADVMVHRLLAAYLTNTKVSNKEAALYSRLVRHVTEQEIQAQEAERESIREYQAAYMEKHVGIRCHGRITGVMPFGIFVRDDATLVEGLIHVRSLPEYMTHHEATKTLRGHTLEYRLGDPISFTITKVDTDTGRIDCALA